MIAGSVWHPDRTWVFSETDAEAIARDNARAERVAARKRGRARRAIERAWDERWGMREVASGYDE
jgi:hypothetical protein